MNHEQSQFWQYCSQVGEDKALLGVLLCDLLIAFIHIFLFLNPKFSWFRVSFLCFHKNTKNTHKQTDKKKFILIGLKILNWNIMKTSAKLWKKSHQFWYLVFSKYVLLFSLEGSCVIFGLWANPNYPHMFRWTL